MPTSLKIERILNIPVKVGHYSGAKYATNSVTEEVVKIAKFWD